MTIDDYDRRKDDRIEAGLCQWCGHAPHEPAMCGVVAPDVAIGGCRCGLRLPPLGGRPPVPAGPTQ